MTRRRGTLFTKSQRWRFAAKGYSDSRQLDQPGGNDRGPRWADQVLVNAAAQSSAPTNIEEARRQEVGRRLPIGRMGTGERTGQRGIVLSRFGRCRIHDPPPVGGSRVDGRHFTAQ